ncbi:MAG: UDP-3-O-(3-hydroxymyristoyl)glucosamine N-acyltransferase [Acidobacteria bacterium]|nr:UDP-3-O-(3-hydroxymyristoyl)glucosamine N-acyltransferase [Acidobacteriota bacterium]
MAIPVKQIAEGIGARILGDPDREVDNIASIPAASDHHLVFAEEESNLEAALASRAAAVIAGSFAERTGSSKTLLIVSHPRLGFARAAALLARQETREGGIHPSAVVAPSARIGNSVTIDPWTFVGERTTVADRSWIGAGSVIGPDVEIGESAKIYPRVTVYPGTSIGNRVIVHSGAVLGSDGFGYVRDPESGRHEKFPQIGRLRIQDDVEIGANTTIDRGALEATHIGRGTKIDNLVHIGHNCNFGENVVIAAQAGFSGSITIENHVIVGGQAGVGEHARIQEGVLVGGQAGILPKKILRGKGVAFWGTPARPLAEYLKSLAALARLGKKER